jgi:predicted permease
MPDWQALVRARLQTGGLRPDREQDVVDDLAVQLEEAYREALGRGLGESDAEAAALAHIPDWRTLSQQVGESKRLAGGALDRIERRTADAGAGGNRRAEFMGGMVHDVRYALRLARQAPMFTAVAVLTLALGIGANATIFSWIDAILLDPIPGADGRDLIETLPQAKNGSISAMSYPDFMDLRATTPAAAGLFAHDITAASLSGGQDAERIWIEMVSDNFFGALNVRMAAGRGFQTREGLEAVPVVVVSERMARARFGSAAAAIDKAAVINRTPFTIVGVTPARFASGYTGLVIDAWIPLQMSSAIIPGANRVPMRNNRWLDTLARLAPGMSIEQASVQLTEGMNRIARNQGRDADEVMIVTPLWRARRGAQSVIGPVLIVLMATVTIVLLIACANISNLLLSRASARSREFALRLSLGCGRGRLIRQLFTESLVLVSFAAVAAAVIQVWTGGLLTQLVPATNMPIGLATTTVSWPVLAFTAGVAFVTAVIFGLAPAMQAGRTDLVTNLKADTGRLAGTRRSWLRNSLVVSQMAFALLLLASAGLFIRSLGNARLLDVGFTTDGVLLGSVDLFSAGYDQTRGAQLLTRVLDEIRAVPGVESASLARRVPLGISTGSSSTTMEPEGYVAPKDDPAATYLAWVAADYFRVMRIPVLSGREFTTADRPDQPELILVNRAFVDRYWPGQNAIGRRVRFGDEWLTVAGVVANSKYRRINEPPSPFVYLSTVWNYRPDVVFHVKAQSAAERFAERLRTIVQRVDPTLPVYGVMTLDEAVQAASIQQSMAASVLSVFGVLALGLASIGLYASMAYSVSRRTKEMGARLALGAAPADIVRLVLRQSARLISAGLVIGLVLTFGAAQLFSRLLVGVRPFDPPTFALVAAVLTVIAIIASYVPARRASRLDPLKALRQD